MRHGQFIDRPPCEQAHSFEVATCSDPTCGLHLIAKRSNDAPICEVVIGRPQLRQLLGYIHDEGLDLL
ncbi:hypothetical protein [Bradyrhizobium sp. 170]|uniref:hypothetical protein n=1 Tax=Bradyrhizobium sp. 170 TaxID=2782641 RepID=UPI001FFE79B8|nr:hypothetical protein [Bradyrhizobium sp. 170]UPK03077.1 hypothetical protein IVB05_36965 [Bradyrhizobium sp. 170]